MSEKERFANVNRTYLATAHRGLRTQNNVSGTWYTLLIKERGMFPPEECLLFLFQLPTLRIAKYTLFESTDTILCAPGTCTLQNILVSFESS